MIKRITQRDTLVLRSSVLRKGIDPELCRFPADENAGAFHLGYFEGDKLVCIGTFFPEDYKDMGPNGFRLRGMASDPDFAGKGNGGRLINFALDELKSSGAAYIWCNARTTASGFYRKLGFNFCSDEFDIPGVGLHYDMYLLF